MSEARAASAALPGRSRTRSLPVTLTGLMVVLGLAAIDANIVGPALPKILEDFGAVQHLAWVLTAFLLTTTAATPLYGKLSDLFGRRPLFVVAVGLFLLGSALSGLAAGIIGLVLGRAVQGLGAGGLMTLTQITMSDLVPPQRRASYQGLFGAVFVGCSLLGPPVGGLLTQTLSWRWIFYVNLPFGVAALALVLGSMVDLPRARAARIDFAGAAISTAATTAALLALSWGGTMFAWSSPPILLLGLAAVMLFAVLLPVERRAAEPIIAVGLFGNRIFTVAALASTLVSSAVFGALAFMPLFLQLAMGLSPTQSGLMMMPMVAGLMLGLLGGGRAITRIGRYRPFVLSGLTIATLVLLALAAVVLWGGSAIAIGVLLGALGLGLGLVMPGTTVALQNAVAPDVIGTATASAAFLRALGNALGVGAAGVMIGGNAMLAVTHDPASATAAAIVPAGLRVAIAWVLLGATALAACALALALLLRDVPLRGPPKPAPPA